MAAGRLVTQAPPIRLSPAERRERGAGAAVFLALLATAAFLPAGRPLPFDLCVLHRLTGVSCLGCGLTRSICHLLQGDLAGSLRLHPAGVLMAAVFGVQVIGRASEAILARPCARAALGRATSALLALAAVVSTAAWIARLAAA
jgi:hypothetical protein